MKKLFNVVADLDTMTVDQMKGAIRNMENIGNLLHAVSRTIIEFTESSNSVLGMSTDRFEHGHTELYLPAVDGGMIIIRADRPDMLVLWQLEFFHKWGNLLLEWVTAPLESAIHYDVLRNDASISYFDARAEKIRSEAALYESMSNRKSF